MLAILLGLFALVNSELVLMSSLSLPTQSNYTIGYLATNNSSACRRISMFKFPAINSGTVNQMAINILSNPVLEPCNVGFSLFNLNGTQVGTTFLGTFADFVSRNASKLITVNVTSTWSLVNGLSYYFVIQTMNSQTSCNVSLPVGMQIGATGGITPAFALITDKGALNKPCGVTPWTVQNTFSGGYIQMRLTGSLITPSALPSASASVSPSAFVSASASASALASANASASVSASASASANVSASASVSASAFARVSASTSARVTASASASASTNASVPLNETSVKAIVSNTVPVGSIVGSVLGVAFIITIVVFLINIRRITLQARSPVSSKTIVVTNPTNGLMFEKSIRKMSV